MTVAASNIFSFLERQEVCSLNRHEISSPEFGVLRQSLLRIVMLLSNTDDQDARDLSDRLRTLLSEWLTAPVPFDHLMLDCVANALGNADNQRNRWGDDLLDLHRKALLAAKDLQRAENPLRVKLRFLLQELLDTKRAFRIYCHRSARPHFESLLSPAEEPSPLTSVFMHSVRDYRETAPFDALIKVGPLRSRGWGSAPDALVSAPRFGTLVQIVWSGCGNEPDFGYDPASLSTNFGKAAPESATTPLLLCGPVSWSTTVFHDGEDFDLPVTNWNGADELQEFAQVGRGPEKRTAVLVQIDAEQGILYPPYSPVLSFDPNATNQDSVGLRVLGDELNEGMYVIIPLLRDLAHGDVHAENGHYSQLWKEKLEAALTEDAAGLIRRLSETGLRLMHLDSAVRQWSRPPTTVIHAPQQIRHFEILLRVLGVGDERPNQRSRQPLFWQRAWNEVRHSRGEAIQAGVQEHEIIEQQLLSVLGTLVPKIREQALERATFRLDIPEQSEMAGDLLFCKICGLEEGFRAPEGELKAIRELKLIYQWRA